MITGGHCYGVFADACFLSVTDLAPFLLRQEQQASSAGAWCLMRELAGMLGNSNLSDVTVVTKGNYQIPAHSFMLCLRSKPLAEVNTGRPVVI